ncbi:hypothetical protein B0O99DRAFT_139376 [Bisporella sp. PMI_857]|nr:hypothetical protein B0O99DRAFT_139376 [Bisporella sp. PMI_857]
MPMRYVGRFNLIMKSYMQSISHTQLASTQAAKPLTYQPYRHHSCSYPFPRRSPSSRSYLTPNMHITITQAQPDKFHSSTTTPTSFPLFLLSPAVPLLPFKLPLLPNPAASSTLATRLHPGLTPLYPLLLLGSAARPPSMLLLHFHSNPFSRSCASLLCGLTSHFLSSSQLAFSLLFDLDGDERSERQVRRFESREDVADRGEVLADVFVVVALIDMGFVAEVVRDGWSEDAEELERVVVVERERAFRKRSLSGILGC